jgi:nucleotide-binding universal stress UspA family protein
MPKTILVHLDASDRCDQRLEAARRLASAHQGAVDCLYAVMPRALQAAFPDFAVAGMSEGLRPADDRRRAGARAVFDQAVGQGLPGRWLDPLEDLSLRGFARQALYADLVIVGQREPDDAGKSGVPGDFAETVLMDSGKPVLSVPYIGLQPTLGETVMVAWKESRETARAVAAALPLLAAARRVHVVTWVDESSGPGRRFAQVGEHLRRHGIEAQLHNHGPEPRDVGGYMLSTAADLGADLIVMGGYGTSRAREWVLGGATRTILRSMTVPVLMVH